MQLLVEMDEDRPKENKQRLFIRACCHRKSVTVTCFFAEPGRQVDEWGGLIVRRKGKASGRKHWKL